MPRTKKTSIPAPEKPTFPDWLRSTPRVHYVLEMEIPSGIEQNIQLTRREYLLLKLRLAEIRGFKVPVDVECGVTEPLGEPEPNELAIHCEPELNNPGYDAPKEDA